MAMQVILLALVACSFFATTAHAQPDVDRLRQLQLRSSINWTYQAYGTISNQFNGTGDDGVFASLLCYSSLFSPKTASIGCDGIRRAQDATGRVWRSPHYIGHAEVNSWSRDESIGITLFIAATSDTQFASKWRDYIYGLKGYTCPESEDLGNNCVLTLPMMCNLNRGLEKANVTTLPMSMVHELPRNWTSAIEAIIKWLRDHHIINESLTEAKRLFVHASVDAAAARNPEVALRQLLHQAFSSKWCEAAGLVMFGGALIDPLGYPLHLLAMQLITRQHLGIFTMFDQWCADVLVERQPLNPMFGYVRSPNSTANIANVTKRILEIGPYHRPPIVDDWSWQRDTAQEVWHKCSGWDFIFLINVVTKEP